jgi:predicted GTPase
MKIDTDQMAQQCIDAINDKIKNLKTLNIIVIGKSGVGKSTLINSLFRGNFVQTGLGRPVTSEIRKIVKKDNKSEHQVSRETGVPQRTIHDRKIKILAKLKRLMNE